MTSQLREAILRKFSPQALERPLIARLREHEARLASDPAILERDRQIEAELRREARPFLAVGLATVVGSCGVVFWLFPGLLAPWVATPVILGSCLVTVAAWRYVFSAH